MFKKILMGLGVFFLLLVVVSIASGGTDSNGTTNTQQEQPQQQESPVVEAPDGSFGDGVWIVGEDIQPGTYRATSDGLCYWERMADFQGDFNSIIANGLVTNEGPVIVEIKATDAGFTSSDCGTWELV